MPVQIASDEDFESLIQTNPKVIVKYYADWCGSCRLLAPKYRRMSDDPRFSDVVFLDINAEQNPKARKMAGVDNLPFIAMFRNGSFIKGGATSREEWIMDLLLEQRG